MRLTIESHSLESHGSYLMDPKIGLNVEDWGEVQAEQQPGERPLCNGVGEVVGNEPCTIYTVKVRGEVVYEHWEEPRLVMHPWS